MRPELFLDSSHVGVGDFLSIRVPRARAEKDIFTANPGIN